MNAPVEIAVDPEEARRALQRLQDRVTKLERLIAQLEASIRRKEGDR